MKRRKRTSGDGSLPVVAKRPDGKYSVAISEGADIIWWSEPAGDGLSRFFVKVDAPSTEFTIKECYGTTETIIDKPISCDIEQKPFNR